MIIRDLDVQMAKETGWDTLEFWVNSASWVLARYPARQSRTSWWNMALSQGPKGDKGTWSEFLKIHADTLWQVDFFSKRIWTFLGPRYAFAMAFVHVANHFVVFSLEHFDHICAEFTTFHHECRPHQSIGNLLIGAVEEEEPPAVTSLKQVRCQKLLGGLLKHYYRAA